METKDRPASWLAGMGEADHARLKLRLHHGANRMIRLKKYYYLSVLNKYYFLEYALVATIQSMH